MNFLKSSYEKVKNALLKTSSLLGNKIRSLFSRGLDENTFEELQQLFYEADLGLQTATELTEKVHKIYKNNPHYTGEELLQAIREEITKTLSSLDSSLKTLSKEQLPLVILIVGVNGNGKTTTVAKLAKYFQADQRKVLIAAADTFRAAAMEQLEIWCQKLGVDLVKGSAKSDPSAIVYDALAAGKARGVDVILIDTAGRLHTKTALMQELEKIQRTCKKLHPQSPHEVLLVLDATTGQNALDQAATFHKFTPISGLVITKLDGTAKGGIVVNISHRLKIPIKFIGTGESLEDLAPFNPEQFAQALFE
jgi:fused signal recognition particle receptor